MVLWHHTFLNRHLQGASKMDLTKSSFFVNTLKTPAARIRADYQTAVTKKILHPYDTAGFFPEGEMPTHTCPLGGKNGFCRTCFD